MLRSSWRLKTCASQLGHFVHASDGAARRLNGNLMGIGVAYRPNTLWGAERRLLRHTAYAVTPTPTAEPTAPVTIRRPG